MGVRFHSSKPQSGLITKTFGALKDEQAINVDIVSAGTRDFRV